MNFESDRMLRIGGGTTLRGSGSDSPWLPCFDFAWCRVKGDGVNFLKFSLVFIAVGLGQIACASTSFNNRIVESAGDREISTAELQASLSEAKYVVVGEKHYTPSVQAVEGQLMQLWADSRVGQKLGFGWEFLAHTEQSKNQRSWQDVVDGKSTVEDFLKATQGKSGVVYSPVLNVALQSKIEVLGLNLTRGQKSPVVAGGISALDPVLLPQGYQRLGNNYRERFEEAMGGHVKPEQFDNYFEAQCLTDDVMADQAARAPVDALFLIAGSFHVDYYDGTVARLKARDPKGVSVTIRILDASDYNQDELRELVASPAYGPIADYVWYVNEPQP